MSDKNTETMTENKEVSSTPEKKKNKSFLVIYSIALFLFAAVLIGLSYLSQLSQARVAADTDKIKQELEEISQKTEVSTGVQTRLEQVLVRNDELEKTNETLTKENDELKKQLEALQSADKKAKAAEYMWQIEKAYLSKKTKECKQLIAEFDEKGLRGSLSADALSELVRIEAVIK